MNKHERTKHFSHDSFIFHASVEMMESESLCGYKRHNVRKIGDDKT